jgi:hypothetical protein
MSTNPYLSMTSLAALTGLLDANEIAVVVGPNSGQGSPTTIGSIPLSSFRDDYLLVTVNEQITALQNKPPNGAFASPVTMTVSGVVTGSTSFDGSANFSLDLSMPDNSIPISAVEDLASTLATIESEIGAGNTLTSSYYSNLNATTQSSILGYWNPSSSNTNGEDQYGTVLQLASDGTLGPDSSNYVNQLLFGSNGTLNWRRNVNNSAWTLVSLWHSGNFTPSNYLALSGGTISGTLAIQQLWANKSYSATYANGANAGYALASGTSATYTDTSSSGTVSSAFVNVFANATLAASNEVTYANAYTLYIAGPPVAGTNVTLTNSYGLYLGSGNTYLGGNLTTNGTTATLGGQLSVTGNALYVKGGGATSIGLLLGIGNTVASAAEIGWYTLSDGTTQTATIVASGGTSGTSNSGSLSYSAATHSFVGAVAFNSSLSTARLISSGSYSSAYPTQPGWALDTGFSATYTDTSSSGTVSGVNAVNAFHIATIAASSAATYTNAATVMIDGAPTAGTNATFTNAYALYVNGGASNFQGPVTITDAANVVALQVNTSGSTNSVVINDTGSNGANLKFVGNGTTTPNKSIRVEGGVLQFINSAYSSVVTSMDDSGDWTMSGSVTCTTITASGLITSGGLTSSGAVTANNGLTVNNVGIVIETGIAQTVLSTWPVATGGIANGGNGGNYGITNHANNNGTSGATSCAAMTFIRDGEFGCFFGIDTTNDLRVGGWSFGNNAYQIAHAGLSSFTFGGTVSSVGVANFNTSDRRLKTNIRVVDPQPLHRKLKWYGYDRIDIDESGEGPIAQDVKKTKPLYVREYDHPLKDTGGKTIKRLTIDKSGIALEQSMWTGHEVDRLIKEMTKMQTRLVKAEGEIKRLKARKKAA